MKSLLTVALAAILCVAAIPVRAQFGSLIVFAPKGEKFTLYIGNTIQNAEPASRVEAEKPGGPSFKIKVIFPDPSVKEISKLVFNKPHETLYYKVDRNAKGVYVLESTATEWMDKEASGGEKTGTVVSDPDAKSAGTKEKKSEKQTSESGQGDAKGCDNPMNEVDFAVSLAQVSNAPFDGPKLSAAKKLADSHCLMVWQVKEVIHTFDQESTRLSFAKYAYTHTYDRDNYDEVKDALHSQKSKTDLDNFLNGKTK